MKSTIRSKQQGSILLIALSAAVIAIIGTIGFIFWANATSPKDTTQDSKVVSTNKQTTNTEETKKSNDGYLVLEDWKIKFKLPENASDIRFYKKTAAPNTKGVEEYYEFTTKRVEELGEQCVEPNDKGAVIRLAAIDRTEIKQEQLANAAAVDNNKPLGDYYYYVSGGQANCSDAETELQSQDRIMINKMLLYPEPL
jgi:hypothetical protein